MNLALLTQNFEKVQRELEEIELLLDEGSATSAQKRAQELLKSKFREPNLIAHCKYLLSQSFEMQARFDQALEAVKIYEIEEVRFALDISVCLQMEAQIALCHLYLDDVPKAVALLKNALADAEANEVTDEVKGLIFCTLSRAYRLLGENEISKNYAQQSLEKYRNTGDWRGMVNTYLSLGATNFFSGDYEGYAAAADQILHIIGDRPATFLLGRAYTERAAADFYLHRPLEGIASLEKSIRYFEKTEHSTNTLNAYLNMGSNLVTVGKWQRAEECFHIALNASEACGSNFSAMVYDALGELYTLRGDFEKARQHQEKAVELAKKSTRLWNMWQAFATWTALNTAMGDYQTALEAAEETIGYARKLNAAPWIRRSQLLFADIFRRQNDTENFKKYLFAAMDEAGTERPDLALAGEIQYLLGFYVQQKNNDLLTAENHFGRAVSIFEITHNVFRTALSRLELGKLLKIKNPTLALENLQAALVVFRELKVQSLIEKAQAEIDSVDVKAKPVVTSPVTLTQALTLRLAEAVASRELLLRELGAVLQQETSADKVIVYESSAEGFQSVVEYGVSRDEVFQILGKIRQAQTDEERTRIAAAHKYAFLSVSAPNSNPAYILVSPQSVGMSDNFALRPILRVVELGLDICALRERDRTFRSDETESLPSDHSLLPGFIHSSPVMRQLVEEITRIRSSDVTVLVTGESGTGKELVSRAIHALSKRKDRIFVPFNCTTLPRELAEGQLFGYRRGAYTGAISDSPGVIRSAAGGTLFLDEIGDLPLDIQPKLLRFLQEGEVQRLGDQQPTKVDVRIIAATNTALEEMVADGKFREDLYYRLNVIRLRVPPLRERRSEIPTIVNYYVNHYSEKFAKRNVSIDRTAVDLLMVSDWQGNVRQLCNEVQRLVARAEDGRPIKPDDLSPEFKRRVPMIAVPPLYDERDADRTSHKTSNTAKNGNVLTMEEPTRLDVAVADLETRLIRSALLRHDYNISRTARELGLTRRGLYMKLERYQIEYKNLETPKVKNSADYYTRFNNSV